MQNHYDAFDEELLEIFGTTTNYDELQTKIDLSINAATKLDADECQHAVTYEGDGISICKDCGCEVEFLDFQPEWRYYGAADSKSAKDPSRCHKSKDGGKGGIEKVFQDANAMNIPLSIRKATENKYKEIVGTETIRGKGRKAIIAACLMYAYRDKGDIRTSDEIRKLFNLGKQEMSTGLFKYHSKFRNLKTKSIKPIDLLSRVMKLAKVNMNHYKNVVTIAKFLDKTDVTLNRSSPQAVAAAIVYIYVSLDPQLKKAIGFSKTQFASDVELSDLTIMKLVKKAVSILRVNVEI